MSITLEHIAPLSITVVAAGYGLQGPAGDRGTAGANGADGIDGDKHYAHDQAVSSAIWAITHSLNKYPSVTVTDSAGDSVDGEVHYTDPNTLSVSFSAPFSGKAFLN